MDLETGKRISQCNLLASEGALVVFLYPHWSLTLFGSFVPSLIEPPFVIFPFKISTMIICNHLQLVYTNDIYSLFC